MKYKVQTSTTWVSKVRQSSQNVSQSTRNSEKELHTHARMCWACAQEAAVQAIRAEECVQHTKSATHAENLLAKGSDKNVCTTMQVCAKVSPAQNVDKEHTKEAGAKFAPQKSLKDKLCEASSHLKKVIKVLRIWSSQQNTFFQFLRYCN